MKGNALSQRTEDLIEAIGRSYAIETIFDRVSDLRDAFDVDHSVYFSTAESGQPYALATYGSEWAKYYEDNQLYRIDPIVGGAFQRFGIYDWADVPWDGRAVRKFKSDALEGGVGNQGLALPIHGPAGDFGLMTVSANAETNAWSRQRQAIEPYMVLIGHYMHEATRSLQTKKIPQFKELSPRERDVLLFLSKGMNRANVADRLKISEHTLRVYVDAARRKLGASNTTHAVARALKLGLISL